MKVRVSYVVNADDDFRKAICHQWGECGRKATRAEVQAYCERVGMAQADDLMQEYEDCEDCHDDRTDDQVADDADAMAASNFM